VGSARIAETVRPGDRLCLYAGDDMIILYAAFPMMTVVQCDIVQGQGRKISVGAKVFQYKNVKKQGGK
jgi:hypothetical protein